MDRPTTIEKPRQSLAGLWNISFGFFGIQIGFALQNANMSRIFQSLGSSVDNLPVLWVAAPLTGLLVQPIIGHMSDRTWLGRLGRRRPYFVAGALLAALSLFLMPLSTQLLMAAVLLWTLDASLNISMEPFRAFVGDMLRKDQHTAGYAVQTAFIGAGDADNETLGALANRSYGTSIVWVAVGVSVLFAVLQLGLEKEVYLLGGLLIAYGLANAAAIALARAGRTSNMLANIVGDFSG